MSKATNKPTMAQQLQAAAVREIEDFANQIKESGFVAVESVPAGAAPGDYTLTVFGLGGRKKIHETLCNRNLPVDHVQIIRRAQPKNNLPIRLIKMGKQL